MRTGERVLLSGSIITGRDTAHKRLFTLIAYDDLGPEVIMRLEIEDFPLIVVINDIKGRDLYEKDTGCQDRIL